MNFYRSKDCTKIKRFDSCRVVIS